MYLIETFLQEIENIKMKTQLAIHKMYLNEIQKLYNTQKVKMDYALSMFDFN